jgi:uncharacterized protein YggT (Ycf19 family)
MIRSSSYAQSVTLPLIDIIFSIAEILLLLRVALRFLGANTTTPFVRWIYETTTPLLTPFANMFPATLLEGRYIIEFSALFALVAYSFLAFLIREIIIYITNRTRVLL